MQFAMDIVGKMLNHAMLRDVNIMNKLREDLLACQALDKVQKWMPSDRSTMDRAFVSDVLLIINRISEIVCD